MPLVWTAAARRDLRSQLQYLAERNPTAAVRVHATIREAVERLIDYPLRGRPGRYEGTRELVTPGLPYLIVYHADAAEVTVLRVLHAAQNWPPPAE